MISKIIKFQETLLIHSDPTTQQKLFTLVGVFIANA